ncbi:MAG: SpoIIIAC/SpoIIIAD family protein [Cellulosilyticaceae bacterium]
MNILQIVAFGVGAALLIKCIEKINEKAMANTAIRLIAIVMLMGVACTQLDVIFTIIRELAFKIKMEGTYLMIIFKIIGIAYIAEFGYQLCSDAGEKGIGTQIQFVGKIMIFVVSSPIVLALIELITQLL